MRCAVLHAAASGHDTAASCRGVLIRGNGFVLGRARQQLTSAPKLPVRVRSRVGAAAAVCWQE